MQGFTLIELLIALAAMAMLAVLSWRGIEGMAQSHTAHRARDVQVLNLQAILAQWRADLDAAQSPDQTLSPMSWDGRTLRITRRMADNQEPALQVVAWSLRSEDQGTRWWRWQSPALVSRADWSLAWDLADQALQSADLADASATALIPVNAWSLSYYANGNWADRTPPTPVDGAAYGVDGLRLILELPPGPGLTGVITQDWLRPTHSMARGD